jgi:imidazolonepropionase-like amidohydrolase
MPMRRSLVPFVSLALLAGSLVPAAPAGRQPAPVVAFVDVGVVPMDREAVVPNQTVLVAGDRIVEIGPAARVRVPERATRIDGRGKFLLPALAEMHAHVPGGGASEAQVERVLFLYAANGVGTIRGMLGHPRHLPLRARIARGELWAPRLYTAGPSFSGASAPSVEVAVKMVEDQKAAGYDFLKIHPGVRRDVMDAVAAAAGRVGLFFAGHVPADVGLLHALELKQRTIDHLDGYVEALARPGAPASEWFGMNLMPYVDEARIPELVAATKAAGTWVVPTESLLEHTTSDEDPEAMAKWPEMRYADAKQVAQWIEAKRKRMAQVPAGERARFIALRRKLIKALHDGGVPLLLGSDAPQQWNVPGFSIHRELQLLVASGLTPYQALVTGTRNVAAFFGLQDEAGTIARGKRADLVLLDGNPLADIAQTARIAGVMLGGRWLPRPAIDERLAGQP